MATHVTLYNFTDQRLRNIKDTLKRAEVAKQGAAQARITIKEIMWLEGQTDRLVISESSDDVTSTAFSLNILKQGNLRGQTLRAQVMRRPSPSRTLNRNTSKHEIGSKRPTPKPIRLLNGVSGRLRKKSMRNTTLSTIGKEEIPR